MRIRTLSVTEVNRYIGRLLEGDPIMNALSIRGEISNFKLYASGHAYFNLKDDGGKLPCVMFKTAFQSVVFEPQEGLSVIARGHMTVYERDGRYQLMVHHLEQEGEGALYLTFLKMKQDLMAKGYFDQEIKKSLPVIRRIGVVTSPDGAAIHDFLTVLKRRNPLIEIVIYPSRVQGDGAANEIASGIGYFNRTKLVDAIVVTRGGGSIEELWAFNELVVAQAIYESQLPIIAAVGHETDTTIADFVSDLRAPTPSAAAELISVHIEALTEGAHTLKRRAVRALEGRLAYSQLALKAHDPRALERRILGRIDEQRQYLDHWHNRQSSAVFYRIDQAKHQLKHLAKTLELHHPKGILKRGYALVSDEDGRVVTTIKGLKTTKTYQLTMVDGVKTIGIKRESSNGKSD